MFSYCFFCPTNSPEPKNSSHAVRTDKDKQKITFKKLEPDNVWCFRLKLSINAAETHSLFGLMTILAIKLCDAKLSDISLSTDSLIKKTIRRLIDFIK